MNALLVLMGLLLLSYLGSFLVGGRSIRGFGLPSGAEYIVLGFAIGPAGLGLLDQNLVDAFDPVASVALGWLALLIGLDYGYARGEQRVSARRLLGGSAVALFTAAAVGAATWVAAGRFTPLRGTDRLLLAGGVGAACSETTRNAVRWVVERHKAAGPVADLVAELASCDDLVPFFLVGVLFGLRPVATLPFAAADGWGFVWWGWPATTIGVGALLGIVATVLLARELGQDETWIVLLGMSFLGIGVSARLGLSTVTAMFVLGAVLSRLSRHRHEIRERAWKTERPVLHPALLLAGAHLAVHNNPLAAAVVAAALVARLLAKLLVGRALGVFFPPARAAGGATGLGLMSSGALAMILGLSYALRFPGPAGEITLAAAAACTILGEFVGPVSLWAALRRAGELQSDVPQPPPSTRSLPAS